MPTTTREFDPEPLGVAPELVGAPLASPWRRGVGFAVDCALLVLPTIAAAFALTAALLAATEPAAFRSVSTALRNGATDRDVFRDLLPLLVRLHAPGLPAAAIAAYEGGDTDRALAVLADYDLDITVAVGAASAPTLPPDHVRLELSDLIPASIRGTALLLVPALYFTSLTAGRRGATLGKRLVGTRVVRLDGGTLGVFASLERFAAYAAVVGSFGFGLADLWRDPNRRMSHDRVAGTVVLRR